MTTFRYGEVEITHLKKRDQTLGAAIDAIGFIKREVNPDLFSALVNSIIGQQVSAKAHATIWERMKNGLGKITPQTVLNCTEAELQRHGISHRKAAYIRNAAERIADGRFDIKSLIVSYFGGRFFCSCE